MSGRKIYAALLSCAFVVTGVSGAVALDRKVLIENNTSYAMREFYASSKGQETWQEDILGTDVLASGQSINVNIDDGEGYCVYDFKAVFENDAEAIQQAVNVCEVGTFTFND